MPGSQNTFIVVYCHLAKTVVEHAATLIFRNCTVHSTFSFDKRIIIGMYCTRQLKHFVNPLICTAKEIDFW